MKTHIRFTLISFLICTILAACGASQTESTATSNQQAAEDSPTPTTLAPTATPTSSASPIPTATKAPTATPTPLPTSTPAPNIQATATSLPTAHNKMASGRIVFQSEQGESTELYIVNPDGSQLLRLTNNNDYELWPVGSPDGEYIAFVHLLQGEEAYEGMDIWVMKADGSGVTPVTSVFGGEKFPNWSPDGRQIAYGCETWRNDICVINIDGSQSTQLTKDENSSYQMTFNNLTTARQWSPNGDKIVFVEGSDEGWGIALLNLDGTGYLRLTTDFTSFDPTWDPTGTKIAFVRAEPQGCEDNCNLEIYVINPDGSELTNLTNNSAEDFNPVWSPNGERVAFVSNRDGNYELYVLDMISKDITRLTKDPAFDGKPTWSPDGQRIAFTSERDGNAEIYVIDVTGENLVRLTMNQVDDNFPYWLLK